MTLKVLKRGHPKLRLTAKPADPALAHHRTLARHLFETMKSNEALGIAANQVFPGELVRIIAVNTPEYRGVMFNPEILKIDIPAPLSTFKEGCLSLDNKYSKTRASDIFVKFVTLAGNYMTLNFKDLSAHVVQHEIDHLNGILISD